MTAHRDSNNDPDTTSKSNGGPSWKYIAITCIGVIAALLITGATIMSSTASRHDEGIKIATDKEQAAENRVTKLETQFESIQRELAEIKALVRENRR
jgi:peptidoglycan hydrolase CwlO-like protein